MLKDLNPTVRSYPRTTDEAFPDRIERAEWFYPPERNPHMRHIMLGLLGIVMWIGIGFVLLYK